MPNPNPSHKFAAGHTTNVKPPEQLKRSISARIEPELYAKLTRIAEARALTLTAAIEAVIAEYNES